MLKKAIAALLCAVCVVGGPGAMCPGARAADDFWATLETAPQTLRQVLPEAADDAPGGAVPADDVSGGAVLMDDVSGGDGRFLASGAAHAYEYEGSREDGLWTYRDQTLSIEIRRMKDEEAKIVWFESEIWTRGDARFTTYMTGGDVPGRSLESPKGFAIESGVVFAISDDYFGVRRNQNARQGVIIRNGVILSDDGIVSKKDRFPPLDILALFDDGDMRAYQSGEIGAEALLAMGAVETYAFGPILVRDGRIGERLESSKSARYREPRCAMGMVAPGHYVVLTVLGRTSESKGAQLMWLAERMLQMGATEAMNLDGGATTALYIMGDLITHPELLKRKNYRGINSLIGLGTVSEEVRMGFLAE